MRKSLLLALALIMILSACSPSPEADPTKSPSPTQQKISTPTQQKISIPTITPVPQGKILTVENTEDSGLGSFRAALYLAKSYDTIVFDPEVFKPEDPATITIIEPLPELNTDHLTIDASNAGVILNGEGSSFNLLSLNNQYIKIQGLHIVNFNGTAIELWGNAKHTTIGGDPEIGTGPLGQGNLITGNRDGILTREGSSYNTFAGNQIGVEFNGLVGNTYSGIQVNNHTRGTIIGPDNIIAYSGAPSIDISTGATKGTTITRNLIYGEETVLRMVPPSANFTPAPVILSYDPAGTVSGIACPGCEVEIFSGEGRWAEFYEGSVTADQDGRFTLSASVPFSGESLKATATSSTGSTSQFSVAMPGAGGELILQEGNPSLVSLLNTYSSKEIKEDNRIGQHAFYPYCWNYLFPGASVLTDLGGLGIKRIRLSFNEMEIHYGLTDQPEGVDEQHYGCINAFHDQGIEVSYIISYWDKEARINGEEVPCERFTNVGPGDPETEDYLQHVRNVVGFLSENGVHKFEIWNEPDNFECTQGIAPENYISLVSLAVPEIKVIDPEAKVYIGGMAGTNNPFSNYYIRTLANTDEIMPIVDGLTWHPLYGVSPAYPDFADYYNNYPSFAEEIKTTAFESGFIGEFRADEMMWRGFLSNPDEQYGYQIHIVPKYYARGILMHLGMDISASVDVNSHMHPMVYYTVRNLSTVMAGNHADPMEVSIESPATNILSYGFTMNNGDRLFTLWTNGAAVEYDPGVSSTLTFTFEDNAPMSVTGVDVLHGYTQSLDFEVEGNQLIIQNLIVKDYPIILKFSDTP